MSQINDLDVFVRVVKAGGMSAAGREMGLSPAVISKRISQLEARLSTRLLQRTTRQLHLTDTGEGFYERAVAILASIEEAEAFVLRSDHEVRGTLKIAAPALFSRLHIAPYLGRFMNEHPDLEVEIDLSDRIVDIVGEGFDVAVRIAALRDSSLVARKLAPSHRVICAAPDYLERAGIPQQLEDLVQHNCLVFLPQDVWRLQGPEGPIDIKVHGNIRSNSSEVVRAAVLSGQGIAMRSTWDIGAELKSGRLKVVLPQYRESRDVAVYAVYPSRQYLSPKVRAFVDFLAGTYGSSPYWDEGLNLESAGG